MNVNFPRRRETAFPVPDTASPGAGKTCTFFFDSKSGNSYPGAGTQLPPAPGKLTHFSSTVNECELSRATGNGFPGAGTQLPPAPGKPTHVSSILNEKVSPAPGKPTDIFCWWNECYSCYNLSLRSSKLAGRRRADFSTAPEKTQDTSALENQVFVRTI